MSIPESPTLRRLRALLLGLVVLGASGLAAELVLLEHWEEWRQWIPLALLAATGTGAVVMLLRPGPTTLRALRAVLLLAVVSGVLGTLFHFRSNVLLEREIAPQLAGAGLVRAALQGGTPSLAPGAMIQLGLLGLLALYRHPFRDAA